MLSAGNPYVLPAVLVAAGAYLGMTALTDLSLLVRVGTLVGVGIALPIVLNRLLGGDDGTGPATEDATAGDGDTAAGEGDAVAGEVDESA